MESNYFDITACKGELTPAELDTELREANNTIDGLIHYIAEMEDEIFELNATLMKYYHLYGELPDEEAAE